MLQRTIKSRREGKALQRRIKSCCNAGSKCVARGKEVATHDGGKAVATHKGSKQLHDMNAHTRRPGKGLRADYDTTIEVLNSIAWIVNCGLWIVDCELSFSNTCLTSFLKYDT